MPEAPKINGLYHYAYPCRDAEETREAVKALCEPVGSKPAGKPRSQVARPRIQPTVNTDGTWRAGNHIMY